jgi:hypothetical protein
VGPPPRNSGGLITASSTARTVWTPGYVLESMGMNIEYFSNSIEHSIIRFLVNINR